MHWYQRVEASLKKKGISKAEIGRAMPDKLSGQAISMKLQGKRPVSVDELCVFAQMAGITVGEAMGENVVTEPGEAELIALFRLLTSEQQKRISDTVRDIVKGAA